MSKIISSTHSRSGGITRREFVDLALKGGTALGLMGIANSLGGCAGQPQVPEAKLESVLVRLLWFPNVQFGGFWAAQDKGYYVDEGLEPNFLPGGPGVNVESIIAVGGEPIGISGTSATFLKAIAQGVKFKCIGTTFQKSPGALMSLPENPVHTPEDAIGKRIGLQTEARNEWKVITKRWGISDDQFEIVPVGFDPSPLVAGQIDAMWVNLGQPLMLKLQGIETVVAFAYDWGAKSYGNFIIALESTLEVQHDMIVRWLRASIKGWEYFQTHPAEIAEVVIEKIAPEQEWNLEQQVAQAEATIPIISSPLTEEKGLLWMAPEVWEDRINALVEIGELEEPIPVENVMTLDFLEEAVSD